ncbi:hypothetical protein Rhopal_001220-T1 [Rhodotorula paludigena]|uniref:DUF7025 domain-containing protein n=1 Tax=Rhodotorula paludigena TaxID=86838 RepID=A0AAV5GET9_9BASI|nr:hypothetical protein Rhopal_001220-T1 [Rhodotorula paludigena]
MPLYEQVEQVAGPGGRWVAHPPPPPPDRRPTTAGTLFTAYHRSWPQRPKHEGYTYLQIHAAPLLRALKAVFAHLESLYDVSSPGIDARAVWVQRERLSAETSVMGEGEATAGDEAERPVGVLLDFLQNLFAPAFETLATYPPGTVSWQLLWTAFEIGMEVEALHDVTGEKIALVLDKWEYVQEAMGRAFVVSCHAYQYAGTGYHRIHVTRKIPEFHRWGEFLVSRLSPVIWRSESFEHLVLPAAYRRIVKALVSVHAGQLKGQLVTDVVAGKGNGLVMALHGAPGTGKLRTILEADVFLTKRDPSHLERNALVGIFLRLLILTTNRIEQFDEAFLSRFAIVLRFDELDASARRTLWERFLRKVNPPLDVDEIDLARLAGYPLNGREIKHAVQSAQALALVDETTLGTQHLDEVLSVVMSGYRGERDLTE